MAFQIDSLCAQNTDRDILNSLADLPRGLPATFERILLQLQRSDLSKPMLAKKIFEIVAVARRPLTLDELREAINVKPGSTAWDESSMANDDLRLLNPCGSFIVVDEEFSTVHFPHSSVRDYLTSELEHQALRHYRVEQAKAHLNFAGIIVTYLNLEVLSKQLIKPSGSSLPYTTSLPSHVVESTISEGDIATRLAMKFLKDRKTTKNPNITFESAVSFRNERQTSTSNDFLFLPYCQEWWFSHCENIHELQHTRSFELWENIVYGSVTTVELPWAPEVLERPQELFMAWIKEHPHLALTSKAVLYIWEQSGLVELNRLCMLLELFAVESICRYLELPPKRNLYRWLSSSIVLKATTVVDLALRGAVGLTGSGAGAGLLSEIMSEKKIAARKIIEYGAGAHALGTAVENTAMMAAEIHRLLYKVLLEDSIYANPGMGLTLVHATYRGNTELVQKLCQSPNCPKMFPVEYSTALVASIVGNKVTLLSMLLKHLREFKDHDSVTSTAMVAAVQCENHTAVEILLTAGADAQKMILGKTLLTRAAEGKNEEIIKLLLRAGASYDQYPIREAHTTTIYETNEINPKWLYQRDRGDSLNIIVEAP